MKDIALVSLASPGMYADLQKRLIQKVDAGGAITSTKHWARENFFSTPMYQTGARLHPLIATAERGAGLYAWTPLILMDAMERFPQHDIIYMDVDEWVEPNQAVSHKSVMQGLFQKQPVVVMRGWFRNRDWTTRDCFAGMGCDAQRFHDLTQVHAGFSVGFRNDDEGRRILQRWAWYCWIDTLMAVKPQILPNYPGFREHRWIQSILTNLIELEGIPSVTELESFRRYSKEAA